MQETHQIALFHNIPVNQPSITNVASIPQRSPFRYPGGKTWLIPIVRKWLKHKNQPAEEFIEPFAGGGIAALTVAFENLARHVTMVELDDEVAAVWKTILSGSANKWLADKIITFELTRQNVEKELARHAGTLREKAFKTILKNRVYHGGILAPGSGLIKNGENGKGLASRWYPNTLNRRINAISLVRQKITFIHGNAFETMNKFSQSHDTAFFIDPPYTAGGKKAGTRLYRHFEVDHEKLFRLTANLKGDFLMTYDNAPKIFHLAEKYDFATKPVSMKNTHHAKMEELLISRNFEWFDTPY